MNRIKIFTIISIVLVLVESRAKAQSMQMDHHHMDGQSRNVFLRVMDTMMISMDKIHQYSSPSATFIEEMIPHHQGAIDMARIEIRDGKSLEMVQLAKSILTEQVSEIMQMSLWLKQLPVTISVEPADFRSAMDETMAVMMNAMPASSKLNDMDRAFVEVMIPHHQAAIDMAKALLKYSPDTVVTAFARQLISNEQVEIEQMSGFIKLQIGSNEK